MSELEQQVRDALHRRGAAVTEGSLRHRAVPARSTTGVPRRPWSWLAPVAAALSVLVVVVIAVALSRGGSADNKAGAGRTAAMLAGTDWRLAEVRYPDGHQVDMSDRVGADVAFERDGKRLDGSDGVNAISAGYAVSGADSLTVGPATASAVGYVGRDPAKLGAVAGFAAVIESGGNVAVHVSSLQLQLSANGFTLTFAYGGLVATSSAPVMTPSGSVATTFQPPRARSS